MGQYGAVIGGVVGASVGFWVGVPQLGWAIGSAIGGAYSASRQVIPGPKIGDVQRQTAQEGGFRPIVYGRSMPLTGNVIADGGPVIVKKRERQGKGGPKVETESAFRTYAVGFCEGESSLLQAWRNGILVYDVEDPSMGPENAKFLDYATWHTGSFQQMPDPDLEAIYGGGTPAFRGTSYLVLATEDVTDQRGAWSQWQVRVFRGASKRLTTPPYPYAFGDSIGADAGLASGEVKDILAEAALHDELAVSAAFTGASFIDSIHELQFGDAVEVAGALQSAEIRSLINEFSIESSELEVGAVLVGAEIKPLLVTMQPFQDRISMSATLTGVTFT